MDNQVFRPTLLDVPISYFEYDRQRNHFANVPAQQTTLRRIIATKYYRTIIETIRAETDKVVQEELKKQLPAITPVAWLRHRKRDTSFSEKIQQQWSLMMGDIDQKDNPNVNMAELKKHLARLPFLLVCAYSVRGGLWFIVRLPDHQTPQTLEAHFRYLQKLFREKLGVPLDPTKGGNPTHLRFVSYDEDPYINENAKPMTGTYTPPPPKPSRADSASSASQDDSQLLNRLVRFTQAAGEGERHARLLKAAKVAGGFVAAGRLDEQTAIYALETVASEWPTFAKSQKTIRDGMRYGQTAPIYPDTNYDRANYAQPRSQTSEKVTATAKPPIWPLAVSSNFSPQKEAETTCEELSGDRYVFKPDESQIERLDVAPDDSYPADWDEPSPTGVTPTLKAMDFFEWQQKYPPFNQLGLASLQSKQ